MYSSENVDFSKPYPVIIGKEEKTEDVMNTYFAIQLEGCPLEELQNNQI